MTPDDIQQDASGEPQRFSRLVIDRIEREGVTPLPRYRFIIQNVALWTFGILSIVFGSVAAAASFFALANAGWRYYVATHDTLLTFLVHAAPFAWLVTLALFIVIGYELFRRTTGSYKYPFILIAAGSVLLSVALGGGLYVFGLGELFDETIGAHLPFYQPTIAAEEALWVNPARGLLAGKIVSIAPDFSTFTLAAFDGSTWKVDGDDLREADEAALSHSAEVRIVGVPLTSSTTTAASFHACFVFPWEVYGGDRDALPARPFLHLESESNSAAERSQECRGVRPYAPLRALEEGGQASSSSVIDGS